MKVALFVLTLCVAAAAQICPVGTNYSLEFDGMNDVVTIPDATELDGFNDFTIEFWLRHATMGWSPVIQKWTGLPASQNAFSFDVNWIWPNVVAGSIEASVDAGAELKLHFNGPVNDGQWHHIALTRSGSLVSLVIDGIARSTGTLSGIVNATSANLQLASLGLFDGNVDEVRIWNIHRTEAEIQSKMFVGLVGTEPGLVGYWRLDEGSGQVVGDSSVYANHGTLGASSLLGVDDPTWSSAAPIPYCLGTGQVNGPWSSLAINGVGMGIGPIVLPVSAPSTLTLDWIGPPNQPFALLAGPINPGAAVVTGLGSLDIGSPPIFSDVVVVFDGSHPSVPFFFPTTDVTGTARQTAQLPSLPPGTLIAIQGLMFQVPGTTTFGSLLTAAFRIDVF